MKKIILILFAFICLSAQSQTIKDWFLARDYYRLGDSTVTFWYGDTLVNTEKVASMINDSISDNTDTIYISGQDEWIGNNDTIYLIDSSTIADTALYISKADSAIYSDTAGYSLNSDSTTIADTALYSMDSIFHDDSGVWIKSGGTIPKADSSRITQTGDTLFYNKALKFTGQSGTYIDSNGISSDSVKINYGLNSYFDNNGTPYIGLQVYSTSGSGVTYPNLKISNIGAGGSDSTIIVGNSIKIANSSGWYGQMTNNTLTFYNSGIYTYFNPSASSNIYRLNTYNDITSGYILDVQNQGTSLFTVKKDSTIVHNILKTDSLSIGGGDILTSSDTIDLKTALESINPDSMVIDTIITNRIKFSDNTYQETSAGLDTTISITAANINDGDSIALLPVPGSGYAWELIKVTFIYSHGASAFSGSVLSYVHWYSNGTTASGISISSTKFGDTYNWIDSQYNTSANPTDENSPIWFIFDSGISGGDGTMDIIVTYKKWAL